MKQLLPLVLLALLLLSAPALAMEGCVVIIPQPDHALTGGNALSRAWGSDYQNAPEDVGGVYWDDGAKKFCVMLVNGGTDARKREIEALVGNADWVSFKSCTYSLAQLRLVIDELHAAEVQRLQRDKDAHGMVFSGIDVMNNKVTIAVHKDPPEGYVEAVKARYGQAVEVIEGQLSIPKTDGGTEEAQAQPAIEIPKTGGGPEALGWALLATAATLLAWRALRGRLADC